MAIKRTILNATDAVETTDIGDDELAAILGDSFSEHQIATMVRYGSLVMARAETPLTTEGQVGGEAFIIVDGDASVRVGGEQIATVGATEIIGEHALITETRRNADVIAIDDVTMFAFTSREFAALLAECPELSQTVQGLDDRRSS